MPYIKDWNAHPEKIYTSHNLKKNHINRMITILKILIRHKIKALQPMRQKPTADSLNWHNKDAQPLRRKKLPRAFIKLQIKTQS